MKEKFTYIIQGPLDVISLDTIDEYLKQGHKVIVSCWDNDSITDKNRQALGVVEENYELVEPYLDRITLIKNKYPQNLEEIYNNGCIYFYALTSLMALKKVKTKYCVIHTSGDSFPDISVVLNKFKKNPNKYYITNRGSHKDHLIKFGMNSAFVLGETKKIKKSRELILNFCEFGALMMYDSKREEGKSGIGYGDRLQGSEDLKGSILEAQPLLNIQDINGQIIHWVSYPETLETLCMLIAAGEAPNVKKSAEQVKKHYDITPLKDFKNFKWSQQLKRGNEYEDRSSKKFFGHRGMTTDKNFVGNCTANHIDEIDIE